MARAEDDLAGTEGPGGWMADQLAAYRQVRETVERGALPLATSVDGRTFEVQASLHGLTLARGAYVTLHTDAGTRLGQVIDLDQHSVEAEIDITAGSRSTVVVRLAVGRGVLLDRGAPFHDARVETAGPGEVSTWWSGRRPDRSALVVGELLLSPGVPAELDSAGLGRHTFMCGQSGSGKTYSLGLLLERVLAETTLRVIILDPNSDYVGLGRLRPDAESALAAEYRRVLGDVAVWGEESGGRPLRIRFDQLDDAARGAVLGLDPVQDADEYAALADLLGARETGQPLVTGLSQLLDASSAGARQLGRRAQNLGILDWAVWDPTAPSLLDELSAPTSRCVVVDLGSLGTVQEQRVVADAVLAGLWARRHAREPVLVVIDEAHNICPAEPDNSISRLSTERVVQIAAEGRKYGIYLLSSTQRPSKVHENIVSQCDNLVLMRMNAASDLAELGRLFSFVPRGLIAGAATFDMGQALVGGRISPAGAAYVQMGRRVTPEGGGDIPATWARPRPA